MDPLDSVEVHDDHDVGLGRVLDHHRAVRISNHEDTGDAIGLDLPAPQQRRGDRGPEDRTRGEVGAQLIEFCRDRIAHYKCPRSVRFVDELPRLPTGKIARRLLPPELSDSAR